VLLGAAVRTPAAITLVQNIAGCQSGVSGVSNFTVTFFGGGAATMNNLLVVSASVRDAATISTPAGYSVIFNQAAQNAGPSLALFYKVASGGETGAQVFFSGPTRPCVSVAEYSGTSFNSPLHGKSLGLIGNGTTLGTGTIDIINTNDLGVAVFSNNNTNFTASYTNPPAGDRYTDETFGGVFGGTTNAKTSMVYADCVVGGCAGTTSTTISNGGDWRGQIASFYPKTTTGNTGTGTNVQTSAGNGTLTFGNVTGAGTTTVDSIDPTNPSQGTPPSGITYTSTSPAYNISTTATFTGSVTVCIKAATITDATTFANLKLLHKEGATLVDRTTALSFNSKQVCGSVTTLSPFIVANGSSPTAAPTTISGTILTDAGAPLSGVVLSLAGSRSTRAITDANGTYSFDNVETGGFYTITPSRTNYSFSPGSRSFSQLGNNTEAAFTAVAGPQVSNPLDETGYFVRQQYLDFLAREPDESGFNFWSDQISSCGADAGCRERRTINVSAAYFLSIEFQQTGGLVDGLYRASYGRAPHYAEFMPDTATVAQGVVVGTNGNWAETLEANKQAFIAAWTNRSDFRAAYDGLTNAAFVDSLISHTAGFNGDRSALVSGLNSGSLTRAAALGQIVENAGFVSAKHNEMFVMMEYFGYLRRDPDAAGYNFWLNKLNQFGGNFEQAEMVKAFIVSGEYRDRFRQ